MPTALAGLATYPLTYTRTLHTFGFVEIKAIKIAIIQVVLLEPTKDNIKVTIKILLRTK